MLLYWNKISLDQVRFNSFVSKIFFIFIYYFQDQFEGISQEEVLLGQLISKMWLCASSNIISVHKIDVKIIDFEELMQDKAL
jgi:hypothetical protein